MFLIVQAHLDEESVTTDTSRTDNSRKRDKDSGLGKTDESTRNEESSEQVTSYYALRHSWWLMWKLLGVCLLVFSYQLQ